MSTLVITERQRKRIIVAALGFLLVAVVAINTVGGGVTPTEMADNGERLPGAEFALFDGGHTTFAQFEGKPLVINFWASWCPACVAELPEFQAVHEELGEDVTFLGLANADVRSAAEDLANEVGLSYTLADDPNGDLFRELGLIAMPSTVFVNAEGRIEEVFGGSLTESGLIDRIEKLTGEAS